MTLDDIMARCVVTPSGCWLGADSGTGRGGNYAKMLWEGATVYVHRWVFRRFVDPRMRADRDVDHLCARFPGHDPWVARRCVRPDHLEGVSAKVNQRRRWDGHVEVRCPRPGCGSPAVWSGRFVSTSRRLFVCSACDFSGARSVFWKVAAGPAPVIAAPGPGAQLSVDEEFVRSFEEDPT